MGDRSGLPKIDRTNGFDDGRDYMRVKKSKLAQQNDQIREALRNRNSTSRTDLFKGISINVNGRTQPTADELKRLILLNGGDYHPYYRYQTTKFMIATNLSTARMKTLRPDDRVIRPEWITESIQAKCLLPYEDYQLFVDEPRGKSGSSVLQINDRTTVRAITDGQSTSKQGDDNVTQIVDSYSSSYRKKSRNKSSKQQQHEITKSRDIREMFSKCVRSLDNGEKSGNSKKKLDTISSSQSSISSNSNDSNTKPNNCLYDKNKEQSTSGISYSHNTNHDETSKSSSNNDIGSQERPKTNKKKTLTMCDFVIKGAKPSRSIAAKVPEKKTLANIRGLTNLDDIIGILNEWVGCPEGVRDEDTAGVTKYFYDLMNEKEYHNKMFEIIDAFQQRVIQHDEPSWKVVYNNLIDSIKGELNHGSQASQNLNQLLTLIEVPTASERNDSNSEVGTQPSVSTIPEITID